MLRPLVVAALCALLPLAGHAAPMGFKGATMVTGDLGRDWRELGVNHAITARTALGAGAMWMRADDDSHRREGVALMLTHRLARWNFPDAQANIWLSGALGALRGDDFDGTQGVLAPGIQLDYETTRFYVAAIGRWMRGEEQTLTGALGEHSHAPPGKTSLDHDYTALRVGVAFTEADYEATQPWLVVEARRIRGLSYRTEVTPMLRLINRAWFVELGMNDRREGRFNFMFLF
jgi:hypothetical protein